MRFRYGTHLPMLIKVVSLTTGPIVEFGGGVNSTIFLHWACNPTGRKLLTLESDWQFYKEFKRLRCDYHSIQHVRRWGNTIGEGVWSVVLIDHHPREPRKNATELRSTDAIRFVDSEYVVMHDSDHYDYNKVYPYFKYKYEYTKAIPNTVVLSNKHDLKELV
jgi:hypothetical protein